MSAIEAVQIEVNHQKAKWGYPQPAMQNLAHALAVLGEEYGEACKAVVELLATPPESEDSAAIWLGEVRTELIQTAAVAVSIVEHIDGGHLDKPK